MITGFTRGALKTLVMLSAGIFLIIEISKELRSSPLGIIISPGLLEFHLYQIHFIIIGKAQAKHFHKRVVRYKNYF